MNSPAPQTAATRSTRAVTAPSPLPPRPAEVPRSPQSPPPPLTPPRAIPAPPPARSAPLDAGAAPVEIAAHFPHVLVAGHPSTVRLRLTNYSHEALENIAVTLDSRALNGATECHLKRLAPGQQATLMAELEPARAGHFVMQVGVVVETPAQRTAYRGTRSLRINQPPDNNIVINIGDIQSNTGGGANAGLGADYGNVHISNLLGGANIKTLNDLLDVELPENFVPVPLDLDYELSVKAIAHDADVRRRPLQIPPAFLGFVQPGTRCVLKPIHGEEREIRLIARPQFRLGRSRADADFVAWFWPRSERNDERTMRISKVQIELRALGLDLVAWDAGSANGTVCDGQPLTKSEGDASRLNRQALFFLANEYHVELEHVVPPTALHTPFGGEPRWSGPTASPGSSPLGCVHFTPHDTEPTPYSAVWLFTEAAFGSSKSNALTLSDPAIAEIQGRLHHYRGCFWVENAVSNGALAINSHRLNAGDIVPLVTGAQITLGGTQYRAEIQE